MKFTYPTETEAQQAYDGWVNAADPRVSQEDQRRVVGVHIDGTEVSLDIEQPGDRFRAKSWVPLEIKRLFTPEEWAAAKTIAIDTWENLALTFEPIPSEIVIQHLQTLVPSVLTAERFTEITGKAP